MIPEISLHKCYTLFTLQERQLIAFLSRSSYNDMRYILSLQGKGAGLNAKAERIAMSPPIGSPQEKTAAQAFYSERGRGAAGKALDHSASRDSDKEKRAALYDGLDTISKTPETTADEKLIAAFAAGLSCRNISDREMVTLRTAALDAIAKALPGTAGAVISKIALETLPLLNNQEVARAVLYGALDSTVKNGKAPDVERNVASFASSVSSDAMTNQDVITVRSAAASAIASGLTGPSGPVITRITLDVLQSLSSQKASRNLLYTSLDNTAKDPGSGAFEKTVASFGNSLSSDKFSDSDVSLLRTLTLKAIQKGRSSPVRDLDAICSIAIDALPSLSGVKAARALLYSTFSQICSMNGLTPAERMLSSFGKEASGDKMGDRDVAKAREIFLKAIMASPNDSPVRLLSSSALEAVKEIGSDSAKRQFLYSVLDTICKNPSSDAAHRKIATNGISATGKRDMDVVNSRIHALESLCEYRTVEEKAKDDLQEMADSLTHTDSPSIVEVEDDYVTIDGLKLKKNAGKTE